MSGGVDSSLCARLLVEHGCSIVGVTMRVTGDKKLSERPGGSCFSGGEEADAQACQRLCEELGAPWYLIDLSASYEQEVLEYFRSEYLAGRTPNPCLRCNPVLKFGQLPRALASLGVEVDWYASGHYVRIIEEIKADSSDPRPEAVYLATAKDRGKDQSYFLQRLEPAVLARVVFPLGGMHKTEVRELARQRGLESADKPDSQDFACREDLPLIFGSRGGKPGNFVRRKTDGSDEILGHHRGLEYYTIGQRRGLALAVDSKALYVTSIDAQRNEVRVGSDDELLNDGLFASQSLWHLPSFPKEGLRLLSKIRLASPPAPSLVRYEPESQEAPVKVSFERKQRAISPGQSVAFYLPLVQEGEGGLRIASLDEDPGNQVQGEGFPSEGVLALLGSAVIEGPQTAEKSGSPA